MRACRTVSWPRSPPAFFAQSANWLVVVQAFQDAGNTTKRLEITSIMERCQRRSLVAVAAESMHTQDVSRGDGQQTR